MLTQRSSDPGRFSVMAIATAMCFAVVTAATPVDQAAASAWGDPQLVAKADVGVMSVDIAVSGDTVHRVWSRSLNSGDVEDDESRVFYQRSDDGGVTWSDRVRLHKSTDPEVGAAVAARGDLVHVVWSAYRKHRASAVLLYRRSTDGGVTWSDTERIAGGVLHPLRTSLSSPWVQIAADGRLVHVFYVKWNQAQNLYVAYVRSDNNGKEWSTPVRVSKAQDGWGGFSSAAGGGNVHLAYIRTGTVAYQSSSAGGLNWEKSRRLFRIPGVEPGPQFAIAAHGGDAYGVERQFLRYGMILRRSTDAGMTWTPSAAIADIDSPRGHFELAADGRWVHVAWLEACVYTDGTVCEDGPNSKIMYQRSGDRGVTWTAATALPYLRPHTTLPSRLTVDADRDIAHVAYRSLDTGPPWLIRTYTERSE